MTTALGRLFIRPVRFGYIWAAAWFGVTAGSFVFIWPKTYLYEEDQRRKQGRAIYRAQEATNAENLLKYLRSVDSKLDKIHGRLGLEPEKFKFGFPLESESPEEAEEVIESAEARRAYLTGDRKRQGSGDAWLKHKRQPQVGDLEFDERQEEWKEVGLRAMPLRGFC